MEEFLESLRGESIISNEEIVSLRQQLRKQYPDFTNMQRAQLFAKAIQQQLDEALTPFKGKLRKKIKFYLLRQTIYREDFCINALDVLHSYMHIDNITGQPIDELNQWLCQYEKAPVSSDELHLLLEKLISLDSIHEPSMNTASPDNDTEHSPALGQAVSSPSCPPIRLQNLKLKCLMLAASLILFTLSASRFFIDRSPRQQYPDAFAQIEDPSITCPVSLDLQMCNNYLQQDLQYTKVDSGALKSWLSEHNSLLANEPYFSTIMDTAKEFNVNPLLLFAITGQEQGFVPKDHTFAKEMANNPFNLYGSWESYNTDIADASRIAARTIIHLGKGCPPGEDQIKWINQSYAADDNWHLGVSYFLGVLKEAALPDTSS